ncbi:MAG: hypothetical protein Fur0044_34230 [Anaerolineae bacterium]
MDFESTLDELRQRIADLEKQNLDLKQELERLRESAERYKTIFETVPISIQMVDASGIIIEVNPYHIKHLGMGKTTKADYLGQYIWTRPSIIQAGLVEKFKRVLAGETLEEEVFFPFTSGGKTNGYSVVRGVPIKQGDKIIGAVFIYEDVTQFKQDQAELLRHREKLEELVVARTKDLQEAYLKLQAEIEERRKAEAEKEQIILQLQEALSRVKTLTGLLPICASCKKIRDDGGYWRQVEEYIMDHSEADFSHGICPDCIRKLYPDFYSQDEKLER